jgi:hypothetical protein
MIAKHNALKILVREVVCMVSAVAPSGDSASAGVGSSGADISQKRESPEVTKEIESGRENLKDKVAEHSASGDRGKAYEAYKEYSDYVNEHYDLSPDQKQEFSDNLLRYFADARGWGL